MDNPLDQRTAPATPTVRRTAQPPGKALGTPLSNLKIWQKLALIAAALGIPLLIFILSLAGLLQRNVQTTLQKDHGALFLREAGDLVQAVPQHRGITNTLRSGNESVAERRAELQERVNADLEQVLAFEAGYDRELQIADELAMLEAGWREIEAGLFDLPAAQVFNMHTAWLQDSLFPILTEVTNTSGLKLDGEQEVVYLTELTTRDLPALTEVLGRMRGFGAGVLVRGELTQDEAVTLRAMAGEVRDGLRNVDSASRYIFEAAPEVQGALNLGEAASLGPQALTLTDEALLEAATPGALTYDSVAYFDQMTEIIDAYVSSFNSSLDVLGDRLDTRVAAARRSLLTTLGLSLLGLALLTWLVTRVARQINRPVTDLATVAERAGQGDLSTTVTVNSRDELGTLGTTFNNTILQLRGAAERDRLELERSKTLQGNIGNFLDVAMDIADGDFTKRGVVSEDALGNVIDAINLMVEEVAGLLQDVQQAALSVNQGAGEMIGSSGAIAESADLTAGEAQRVRTQVENVMASIREMATQADNASDATTSALRASRQGQEAVTSTLTGMAGIREETRATAERVRQLGERSNEISEIVETISHIASQTNLLALGAALEAAGAGEAGDRFGVVADEVRKLADESAEAAGRIFTLIGTVQTEVREVGEQVARNSREVESGYALAGEAGERLREISDSVQRSARLAESISRATDAQTSSVEEVGASVASMAELTQNARGRVLQGQQSAATLQNVASRLSEALVRFRLA